MSHSPTSSTSNGEPSASSTGASSAAVDHAEPLLKAFGKGKAKPKSSAKASAAKPTAKKAPVKRGPATAAPANVATSLPRYPRHNVERALRVANAIIDQAGRGTATIQEVAKWMGFGSAHGPFRVLISSAKKYGFVSGENSALTVTDRARRAINPQSDSDRERALQEAILEAPDISDVYNNYRGESLPDAEFFENTLADKFKIPREKLQEFSEIFLDSVRSAALLDESGPRPKLLDVGRDDAHRVGSKAGLSRATAAAVKSGATCFVMQPFGGHLGGYYETIFKPAIEQTGLVPVRADAEIFGTGKIMDQVWRGISEATVLVAELTSKNANVFYELGLAHALEKPVVLVSSNTDDVPFDLRHIRVILYDQSDPFWGQKLIDKVADNIKSALEAPEEAIFRVDQP
jgi:hypothetical protein